ncbi:methylated-DNA--[protein]-cysteine S-methyltransferase [Planctomyces sp. SH-PL62]|uniref:methylated-DNA--[protein]-cysteine S-methyltransferase n=1 Tax=Planctomyces sp. SH-PL62 TaxID=1636152 RepID=UPI00078D36F3|nr:methylated-DNA--[protein]-cysteine S-methyltransferase [Planctomyces sp. SH-PL62]AMV40272.1 Methylated-DNA--protein-cysteine methyltransferase [Planctomyces sp. SH-PL62]
MTSDGTIYHTTLRSPIGDLLIVSNGEALTGLYTEQARYARAVEDSWKPDPGPFREAERWLQAYFEGEPSPFDLRIAPRGTDFQHAVWSALRTLRFGERVGYGELARRLGRPGAGRAVGHANARNPISLVVPCHRVVGAGGGLTGYAGGLDRKLWLLEHEARCAARTGASRWSSAG